MSRRTVAGPADSPWLDVRGAARRTRTSIITIRRAIHDGKLIATRINNGRVYRIHTSWCDAWLGLGGQPPAER
jgi:excisionase family DNA binding protein